MADMKSEQKKKNLTLGLILGSIVLVFFIGFIVRLTFFGTPKRPQMAPIGSISVPAAQAADGSAKP
jgi:hypothetical protein